MLENKKIKRASRPIPEEYYDRFKFRLEEESGIYADRNLVLFQLGIATGYRLQDLNTLLVGDISEALQSGFFLIQEKKQYKAWKTVLIRNPKSKRKKPKIREHRIIPELASILKQYIKGKRKSDYAFASQKTNQGNQIALGVKAYSDLLSKVGNNLGLKQISGHSLRKTYATRLWEETRNLEYVRIALGHTSIEVTKVYLGLDEEIRIEAAKIAGRKL